MMKFVFIILFAAALVIIGPLAAIWAVNTLFNLGIPYTIATWTAALILTSGSLTNITK